MEEEERYNNYNCFENRSMIGNLFFHWYILKYKKKKGIINSDIFNNNTFVKAEEKN